MADVHQQNVEPVNNVNTIRNTNNRIYIERRRIPASDLVNQIGADGNPRFGVVRDRLFHAMLVRLSLPYSTNFPVLMRRFIEFATLVNAITLLTVLIYTHFLLSNYPAQCLDHVKENWPRKGIVRVEVIRNLEEFRALQLRRENVSTSQLCHFDLAEILRRGKLPAEIGRHKNREQWEQEMAAAAAASQNKRRRAGRQMPIWVDAFFWLLDQFQKVQLNSDEEKVENGEENEKRGGNGDLEEHEDYYDEFSDDGQFIGEGLPLYHHLFEFSLHYGLLRLNAEMRHELDLDMLVVQLDVEKEACLANWRGRPLMRYLVGLDELVMASVKQLSENETERGYLRDLLGGDLYHFVSVGPHSSSHYLTAMSVMLIFTFAISMLLRFSHDQIFVFIVDLFQMFEQNLPLIFPIAPLLTVILALVGMEAIMSEIFNDTSTAFYVILLVWMADQYDAIFCHSPIGRRYWLRFFYLYHFAFYAYQYRYNGIYSGLALLTSAAFTLHSMVFFFHHYELPHIIFQEQLATAVLTNTTANNGTIDMMRIRRIATGDNTTNSNATTGNDGQTAEEEPSIPAGNYIIRERSLQLALSVILQNPPSSNTTAAGIAHQSQAESGHGISDPEAVEARRSSDGTERRTSPEEIATSIMDQALREALLADSNDNTTTTAGVNLQVDSGSGERIPERREKSTTPEETVASSIVDEAMRQVEDQLRNRTNRS